MPLNHLHCSIYALSFGGDKVGFKRKVLNTAKKHSVCCEAANMFCNFGYVNFYIKKLFVFMQFKQTKAIIEESQLSDF